MFASAHATTPDFSIPLGMRQLLRRDSESSLGPSKSSSLTGPLARFRARGDGSLAGARPPVARRRKDPAISAFSGTRSMRSLAGVSGLAVASCVGDSPRAPLRSGEEKEAGVPGDSGRISCVKSSIGLRAGETLSLAIAVPGYEILGRRASFLNRKADKRTAERL